MRKLLLFILSCCFSITALAQTGEKEADLKAVFIYNFTKYIDWDSSHAQGNFVIGVIGSSGVTETLNEIAKNYSVNNRKIVIKHFNKPEDIDGCQILFIPGKTTYPLQSILDKVHKGVLTVSEQNGYAKQGTALNFVVVNDKLKFEANLNAIYTAGLKAGSQLLKLAIIID